MEFNAAAMVDNGFNALTREQRDKVELGTLHMWSALDCVLGQIFENFGKGLDALFPEATFKRGHELAYEHGFFVPDNGTIDEYYSRYAALAHEWKRRLGAERQVDALQELLKPIGAI